jgi:hypothetical protein
MKRKARLQTSKEFSAASAVPCVVPPRPHARAALQLRLENGKVVAEKP